MMLSASVGNSGVAHQRREDVIVLGITSVAGLVYLPLAVQEPRNNLKAGVAEAFGSILCEPSHANISADYLLLMGHPRTCSTVMKVESQASAPPLLIPTENC